MNNKPGGRFYRDSHKRHNRAIRKVAHRFGQVYRSIRLRREWANAQEAKGACQEEGTEETDLKKPQSNGSP